MSYSEPNNDPKAPGGIPGSLRDLFRLAQNQAEEDQF